MARSHELGRRGEEIIAHRLERQGWRIEARNFRFGHRELDLVVRRGRLVVFVEVKTRAGSEFGHPLEAITARKRREVEHVARHWIREHGREGDRYRFDAAAVCFARRGEPVVEYVTDAWRC